MTDESEPQDDFGTLQFDNSKIAGTTISADTILSTTGWTIQPVNSITNEAGDTIEWGSKTGWEPKFVRKPRKTITGAYETGKLYRRTHTITVTNACMDDPQVLEVEEWATMEDIIGARLGQEDNGC